MFDRDDEMFEAVARELRRPVRLGDGLTAEDRLGAFLGLGSTYRAFGAHDKAVATLRRGLTEYPGDTGLTTFLAMALYNAGAAK